MKKLIIIAAVALTACSDNPTMTDQCMRVQLFQECMKALPAGPQDTKYNDWDEVVAKCDQVSYWQSQRKASHVKLECRS